MILKLLLAFALMQQPTSAMFGVWTSAQTYAQGDITMLNGVSYLSFAGANTGNNPSSTTGFWGALIPGNVLQGSFTTTAVASESFTFPGIQASSHCAHAHATGTVTGNVTTITPAAGSITVQHDAVAGITFELICTMN
jgi:hypothetical protein